MGVLGVIITPHERERGEERVLEHQHFIIVQLVYRIVKQQRVVEK
jgi:hypothetical protein